MLPQIYIAGMFRCGSTLTARMLNAHKNIACASDVFQPIFRSFRNSAASAQGLEIDGSSPFDDYYFYHGVRTLYEAVQSSELDLAIPKGADEELRRKVAQYSAEFSPRLAKTIHLMTGTTYADLIRTGYRAIGEAYGTACTELVASKTTWSSEFVPHVLTAFPTARAIEIVRDPRAVCASKLKSGVKYPWLFLCRHWRKHATLAWLNATNPVFGDRVRIIRYEDLVLHPEHTVADICAFLELDYDPAMVDVSSFDDGAGNRWAGNSSHFETQKRFEKRSVSKWSRVLDDRQTGFIDALCGPEMALLGYDPAPDAASALAEMIWDPPEIPSDEVPDWLLDMTPTGDDLVREIAMECWRADRLATAGPVPGGDRTKRACALDVRAFDRLQAGATQAAPVPTGA